MKDIDKGIVIGMLMGGKRANLGSKNIELSFTDNGNYSYSYDPQDEPTPLDGYNAVSVDVEVDVDDRYDDGYSDGYNAGYTAGQSSVPIEPLNVTINDTYEAQSGGYSPVVVNVPQSAAVTTQLTAEHNNTYTPPAGYDGYDEVIVNVPVTDFPEYNNLIACQQQIAAKLGLEPPYDCEDIEEAIDELDGYTFPEGTPYNDVETIVAGSPHELKDNQNGGRISWTCGEEPTVVPYWGDGITIFGRLRFVYPDGTVYILCDNNPVYSYVQYPNYHFMSATYSLSYSQVDGSYSASVTLIIDANGTVRTPTETRSGTCNGLIGYGDSSHTFSVKNKE